MRVRLNTDRLEDIVSMMSEQYLTRVGILGSKTNRMKSVTNRKGMRRAGRESSSSTNADIGLIHEKGSLSRHIPRRSFLEMPLVVKSDELLKVKKHLWDSLISGGQKGDDRMRLAYKKLGIAAENIIQLAFTSGGYGRWAADKSSTIARKRSSAPLIDTAQLRRSITSMVVAK